MQLLNIYYIDNDYIDYLRKFDSKVFYNKNRKRPYIGVVYKYNNYTYFAPLASPKPKHIDINAKSLDVFKIQNGKLGIVNLNNMIPTPKECLTLAIPEVTDPVYKSLLENQLSFLNDRRKYLFSKIEIFQTLYQKDKLPERIKNRCCNFRLLEEKCQEYGKITV